LDLLLLGAWVAVDAPAERPGTVHLDLFADDALAHHERVALHLLKDAFAEKLRSGDDDHVDETKYLDVPLTVSMLAQFDTLKA
jgi:hypothetical protein